MIEVFDEKDVEECLSEIKDSNIKTYAFCLLDWAIQKRKVQAISLDKVKQTRDRISDLDGEYLGSTTYISNVEVLEILDELIAESEG